MIYNYPLIVHEENGYWGEFPDIEGCNAQGDTISEILEDAKEALETHILCMLTDGEKLNKPSHPKKIKTDKNSFVTIITADVDLAKEDKSIKKTLTIPKWLNDQAEKHHLNFSKALQEVLIHKVTGSNYVY